MAETHVIKVYSSCTLTIEFIGTDGGLFRSAFHENGTFIGYYPEASEKYMKLEQGFWKADEDGFIVCRSPGPNGASWSRIRPELGKAVKNWLIERELFNEK